MRLRDIASVDWETYGIASYTYTYRFETGKVHEDCTWPDFGDTDREITKVWLTDDSAFDVRLPHQLDELRRRLGGLTDDQWFELEDWLRYRTDEADWVPPAHAVTATP